MLSLKVTIENNRAYLVRQVGEEISTEDFPLMSFKRVLARMTKVLLELWSVGERAAPGSEEYKLGGTD